MFTGHTNFDTFEEAFNPPLRTVNFADNRAVVLVSAQLRLAWTSLPPPSSETHGTTAALEGFVRDSYGFPSDEERERKFPRNHDKEEAHSEWRKSIYYHWNHVFWDVMGFLTSAVCFTGHIHPPAEEALALSYPEHVKGEGTSVKSVPVRKVWEHGVVMCAAHLEKGVKVRVTLIRPKGGVEVAESAETTVEKEKEVKGAIAEDEEVVEVEAGFFSAETGCDAWYIKKGTAVNFYVEDEGEVGREGERTGVAAVMVYGKLCNERHGRAVESEEKGEAESEEEVVEAVVEAEAEEGEQKVDTGKDEVNISTQS